MKILFILTKNKTEIILNNLILNAIDQHKMFKINDPIKLIYT